VTRRVRRAQQSASAAACGAGIGTVQCGLALAGMHAVARSNVAAPDSFEGLGVAARYGLLALLISVVLFLIASRLLALKRWVLAAAVTRHGSDCTATARPICSSPSRAWRRWWSGGCGRGVQRT